MISAAQREFFDQNGYVVVSGLFSKEEAKFYTDYYMELRHDERACRGRPPDS